MRRKYVYNLCSGKTCKDDEDILDLQKGNMTVYFIFYYKLCHTVVKKTRICVLKEIKVKLFRSFKFMFCIFNFLVIAPNKNVTDSQ